MTPEILTDDMIRNLRWQCLTDAYPDNEGAATCRRALAGEHAARVRCAQIITEQRERDDEDCVPVVAQASECSICRRRHGREIQHACE